jgi:ribosomal protein S18 acetylase RimI-like enzyme
LGDTYEVGNFGHSGATLLRRGHRPYHLLPEFRKALDFCPDRVVIHLGLNDTDPRNWPHHSDDFVSDYRALIASSNNQLFLLQDDGQVIGMLTVGIYLSPTGSKAWIEDVVVDSDYRGQGLGRQLVSHAIEHARHEGYDSLMLTSAPKRIAANALYRALGFEHKETNVYTYPISR